MKKQLYSALVVALFTWICLMTHSEYLFALQDNSLYMSGHTFMQETLNREQGLWIWVGCYLTQFFYYPWVGAIILSLVWGITFICLTMTFRLKDWWMCLATLPIAFQVYAVSTFGYWIYYSKCPGYAFAMAICILAFSAISLFARVAFTYCIDRQGKIFYTIIVLCGIVYVLTNPVIKIYSWTLPCKEFYAELRMYRAIDENRWDDVIDEVKNAKTPTNLMVMYKNIALMHTDRLGEMFTINNCGTLFNAPDSLNIRISQLGASMIYYQFGQINFSYRWAMENSVEYGFTIRNLKILTKCAILNQEMDVAEKYLNILKATKFHKDWAYKQGEMLYSSTNLVQSEDFKNIAPLVTDDEGMLDNDNGMCEEWLLQTLTSIQETKTQKLENIALSFSLWTKNCYVYSIRFYDYVQHHQREQIPHLYQEGAILFGSMEESPIDISKFEFDNIIDTRYNEFAQAYNDMYSKGVSEDEMAEKLKPLYGNTYWWYYYFYKNFTIY